MRAHHGHVAGVIVHALVLLVGLVVFLVDDDQPEIRVGKKQRRARADHDLSFACRDGRPSCARGCAASSSECHSSGRTPKRAANRSRNCPSARSPASGSAPACRGGCFRRQLRNRLRSCRSRLRRRAARREMCRSPRARASRPPPFAASGKSPGRRNTGSGGGGGGARGIGSLPACLRRLVRRSRRR